VIDGSSSYEFMRHDNAWAQSTPAVADLDGDRMPEIAMVQAFDGETFPEGGSQHRRLAVLEADGRQRFSVRFATPTNSVLGPMAIAIADLDHDGAPEILAGLEVFDGSGVLRWVAGDMVGPTVRVNSPVAVDLDGDMFLEVITGSEAYRHDGSLFFENDEVVEASDGLANNALTAVADLDLDGTPEIVVSTRTALFVLDSTGKTRHRRPLTNAIQSPFMPTIGAIDGTGAPSILLGDGYALHAFRADLTPAWQRMLPEPAGSSVAVAFDFLGDRQAEVVFGDDKSWQIFDGQDGVTLYELQRTAVDTRLAYPVIAELDGDGVADLILTHGMVEHNVPSLRVWSDLFHWSGARRIMNQESYHVTNVNDDGSIPQFEEPHWRKTNGFRSQVGAPVVTPCKP
jgi:hypothetical protein